MPQYEYECRDCGKTFEAYQNYEEHDRHEDHDKHQQLCCPGCGSKQVEQRLSTFFVHTSKKS